MRAVRVLGMNELCALASMSMFSVTTEANKKWRKKLEQQKHSKIGKFFQKIKNHKETTQILVQMANHNKNWTHLFFPIFMKKKWTKKPWSQKLEKKQMQKIKSNLMQWKSELQWMNDHDWLRGGRWILCVCVHFNFIGGKIRCNNFHVFFLHFCFRECVHWKMWKIAVEKEREYHFDLCVAFRRWRIGHYYYHWFDFDSTAIWMRAQCSFPCVLFCFAFNLQFIVLCNSIESKPHFVLLICVFFSDDDCVCTRTTTY